MNRADPARLAKAQALRETGLSIRSIVQRTGLSRETVQTHTKRIDRSEAMRTVHQDRRETRLLDYLEMSGAVREAGEALIAACHVGTRATAISARTGLSLKRVHLYAQRFRENGIFCGDEIVTGDWESHDIAFLLDAMCGAGLIRREDGEAGDPKPSPIAPST